MIVYNSSLSSSDFIREAIHIKSLTRREFIKTAGAASAGVLMGVQAARGVDMSSSKTKRPNILFAIADDWSWPHAGVYGDKVVKTPTYDRIAAEGVLFTNAFCAAPTCTASRGAILTGQAIHRLREGANLWSTLPADIPVYPDILEKEGYVVGCTGKGWGPGSVEAGGRTRNPAGPHFESFDEFLKTVPEDTPFCFWFGSLHPHRGYKKDSGIESGMKLEDVKVPPFLPDTPEIRKDVLDYYFEVQQFDNQVSELLETLEKSGRAENTIVVMTSDNGLPFPRAKTTLYDSGTHMPLAIKWPARIKGGRTVKDLVGFTDFAPTFLKAAGLKPSVDMSGVSFLDLLTDGKPIDREAVFTERERHTICRKDGLSYPCRAIRTKDYLYIRNLRPHLLPAGDPDIDSSQGRYSDIDGSPSKSFILDNHEDKSIAPYFNMACAKRPEEELYDIKNDPWQLKNVADSPDYQSVKQKMRAALDKWMKDTGDPRINGEYGGWDKAQYRTGK